MPHLDGQSKRIGEIFYGDREQGAYEAITHEVSKERLRRNSNSLVLSQGSSHTCLNLHIKLSVRPPPCNQRGFWRLWPEPGWDIKVEGSEGPLAMSIPRAHSEGKSASMKKSYKYLKPTL